MWLMRAFLVVLVVALVGCEQTRVEVQCNPIGGAYVCEVSQVSGSASANTCWTVRITCANGTVSAARRCQDTEPNSRVSAAIQLSEFSDGEKCDMVSSTAVLNLTITEH